MLTRTCTDPWRTGYEAPATEYEHDFTIYFEKDNGKQFGGEIEGEATIKPVDDVVIVVAIRMDGQDIDRNGSPDEQWIWAKVDDYFEDFDVRELGE